MGQDEQYCYPDSDVLINKLGITDSAALEEAEIELTQARIDQFEPDFDDISLPALRAIHFHLFQDLYHWAGELRTVDVSKGGTRFANVNRIEPEANKLFRQLGQEACLAGLPRDQFVTRLAHYY
jgi:cell filamentation protein